MRKTKKEEDEHKVSKVIGYTDGRAYNFLFEPEITVNNENDVG